MAKEPRELKWIEGLLPEGEFRRKNMFGGFIYYVEERVVLAIFESTGHRTYQNKKYPFEVWSGCMFPVEKEHQAKALLRFPFLVIHPILQKWLYLPMETENFDELVSDVLTQALNPRGYWGSIPKPKASKKKARPVDEKNIDTRKPRIFSDEAPEQVFAKAERISDLKNLGPKSEKEFHKAGIKTVKQFQKLGWKKTMVKLTKSNPENRHSVFAYAIVGALTNRDWQALSKEERQEVQEFVRSLPK